MRPGLSLSFTSQGPAPSAPRRGRIRYEHRDGRTVVEIRADVGWGERVMAILSLAYCAAWLVGLCVIAPLGVHAATGVHLLLVPAGWAAVIGFVVFFCHSAAWTFLGRETFTLTDQVGAFRSRANAGRLTLTTSLLGIHRTRAFELSRVANVAAVDACFPERSRIHGLHAIAFDLDGVRVRSRVWLARDEALFLLAGPLRDLVSRAGSSRQS